MSLHMRTTRTANTAPRHMPERLMLFGITFGVLYWFLESAVHAVVLREGTLVKQIASPSRERLWMRLLVVCVLVVLSICARWLIGRRKREKPVSKPNGEPCGKNATSKVDSDTRTSVAVMNRAAQASLRAERERVMKECVGAACHHFAQPLMVLLGNLELMRNRTADDPKEWGRMIEQCLTATERLAVILRRFQQIEEYRTVTDLEGHQHILDIGLDTAKPPRAA